MVKTCGSERSGHINTNRGNKEKKQIPVSTIMISHLSRNAGVLVGMDEKKFTQFSFSGSSYHNDDNDDDDGSKTIIIMMMIMMTIMTMITIEVRLPTAALRKILRYDFAKTSWKLSDITGRPSTCNIENKKKERRDKETREFRM